MRKSGRSKPCEVSGIRAFGLLPVNGLSGKRLVNMNRISDEDLFLFAKQGYTCAWDHLCERYGDLIEAVAAKLRYMISGHEPEDFAQERRMNMTKNFNPKRGFKFGTHIAIVLRSRAIDIRRHEKRNEKLRMLTEAVSLNKPIWNDEGESGSEAIDRIIDPQSVRSTIDEVYAIEQVIQDLDEEEQYVLTLHLSGVWVKDIARAIGRSKTNTWRILDGARQKVREALIKQRMEGEI